MSKLVVWIPHLPPTSNNIYVRHPAGKGKILSDKARAFKVKAMQTMQKGGRVALLHLTENVPYELRMDVFFKKVEVAKSTTGARYAKMDLSNRIKLIEDTVAEAIGLDDCHNFRLILEKHCDPKNPGIYVTVQEIPEEEVGLTKESYELRQPKQDRNGDSSKKAGSAYGASWFKSGGPRTPSRRKRGPK